MNAAFSALIHRPVKASPTPAASGPYTGNERSHGLFMTTRPARYPQPYAQPVKAVDALILALRSPVHASPKLRPIADELEAFRDRS